MEASTLCSSKQMSELSQKLGMLESYRHLCESVHITMPGIVVVGEQSAGKSSLLESISGIEFPRAQNTCTRMPCVVTLLTNPKINKPYAMVSMDAMFRDSEAEHCEIEAVGKAIQDKTDLYAEKGIAKDALHIRVFRKAGPQLSLIDLPGITHNADDVENIHEVTVQLVEKYIQQEEMVILCVVPGLSDFGNAEVLHLAAKYDKEGKRTLGVVTKCDDAAKVEACDIVAKVAMSRSGDVKLKLGFHCVINRSQPDIESKLSQAALRKKEKELFESNDRLKEIPAEKQGTERLMDKIASIQAQLVERCLPKIKAAVSNKREEQARRLGGLPRPLAEDRQREREFNRFVRQVLDDFLKRAHGDFIDQHDKHLIAPSIDKMVKKFLQNLVEANPKWLAEEMYTEILSLVKCTAGYTVGNLSGSAVFRTKLVDTFVKSELLEKSSNSLLEEMANHLVIVVKHIIEAAAPKWKKLQTACVKLCIQMLNDQLEEAKRHCSQLVRSQVVTIPTDEGYNRELTTFRERQSAALSVRFWDSRNTHLSTNDRSAATALPSGDFWAKMPKEAAEFFAQMAHRGNSPEAWHAQETCMSLFIRSRSVISNFVESASKLARLFLVEDLPEKLEQAWREDAKGNLAELLSIGEDVEEERKLLTKTLADLKEFEEKLSSFHSLAKAGCSQPKTEKSSAAPVEAMPAWLRM